MESKYFQHGINVGMGLPTNSDFRGIGFDAENDRRYMQGVEFGKALLDLQEKNELLGKLNKNKLLLPKTTKSLSAPTPHQKNDALMWGVIEGMGEMTAEINQQIGLADTQALADYEQGILLGERIKKQIKEQKKHWVIRAAEWMFKPQN